MLPLLAAVLNKLQLLGVPCEVRADDAAQSLVIVVHGATVEPTPEGRRRLVMRSASASVSVKGD